MEKSRYLSIGKKLKLEKLLFWTVSTYGCESCTMKNYNKDKLNAFEIKGLRQILRISGTEKKTNEWVLEKAGTEKEQLATI